MAKLKLDPIQKTMVKGLLKKLKSYILEQKEPRIELSLKAINEFLEDNNLPYVITTRDHILVIKYKGEDDGEDS